MPRVKLKANLGADWPERWKNGEVHAATEDIAKGLILRGLAVLIEEVPLPVRPSGGAVLTPAAVVSPPKVMDEEGQAKGKKSK